MVFSDHYRLLGEFGFDRSGKLPDQIVVRFAVRGFNHEGDFLYQLPGFCPVATVGLVLCVPAKGVCQGQFDPGPNRVDLIGRGGFVVDGSRYHQSVVVIHVASPLGRVDSCHTAGLYVVSIGHCVLFVKQ